jgi:hypothetical protein
VWDSSVSPAVRVLQHILAEGYRALLALDGEGLTRRCSRQNCSICLPMMECKHLSDSSLACYRYSMLMSLTVGTARCGTALVTSLERRVTHHAVCLQCITEPLGRSSTTVAGPCVTVTNPGVTKRVQLHGALWCI